MKLTDIQPLEDWTALERDLHERFHVDVNVFDTKGVRISEFKEWVNRLCPEIKATDKGQSFICAVAHMNVAAMALQTREPQIEECDAGLVKIVVPIFAEDEFVGAVGACGLLLDEGEIDTFLINKITEIDEERAEQLATDIGRLSSEDARALVAAVQKEIDRILQSYHRRTAQ